MVDPTTDITQLLNATDTQRVDALEKIASSLMDDLRRIAQAHSSREAGDHTLGPTAIVNEAWMRLAQQDRCAWQSREHFLSVASVAMRRLLIDHARKRNALIRGGDRCRVQLTGRHAATDPSDLDLDLEALSAALEDLESLDPELARVVDLRFLAGLSVEQVATVTDQSPATVKRRWSVARGWLKNRLETSSG